MKTKGFKKCYFDQIFQEYDQYLVDLLSANTFLRVRFRAAGQAPSFCSPGCLHQNANLLSMCANSLKRPRGAQCQESLWRTGWTKTW